MLLSISSTSGVETGRSAAHMHVRTRGYQQKCKGRCKSCLAVIELNHLKFLGDVHSSLRRHICSMAAGCPCCGRVSLVSEGSDVAERRLKHLCRLTFGLSELHLSVCIIALSAEVFEKIFRNSFWILCINFVLMCHCCKSMKGLRGKKKQRPQKVKTVQIYRMEHSTIGKSIDICSYVIFCRYMIFCRNRKWSNSLNC